MRTLARFGVAVGYTLAFVVTDLVFRTRSPSGRAAWLEWTSTNLVNLRHHPVAALVASAFFAEGSILTWTVLALVGLGVVNASLGNWRTALLVGAAHVVGTLISEGILAYRIGHGDAPASDRLIVDVGPSYVVTCALVAGICYGPGLFRLLPAAGFALLAPSLFGGLPHLEVSSVGHLCAVMIAVMVGWPLWRGRAPARAPATAAI